MKAFSRVPSLKTLRELRKNSEHQLRMARRLLDGRINVEATAEYDRLCSTLYHKPRLPRDLPWVIFNTLNWQLEFHGIEYLKDKKGRTRFMYLNAGDTYAASLFYSYDTKAVRLSSIGDIVEHNRAFPGA